MFYLHQRCMVRKNELGALVTALLRSEISHVVDGGIGSSETKTKQSPWKSAKSHKTFSLPLFCEGKELSSHCC
jgi:hypothetical protein